jgi:hypothetical protein
MDQAAVWFRELPSDPHCLKLLLWEKEVRTAPTVLLQACEKGQHLERWCSLAVK